ncbi:TVP38/TMEM64 family protein [Papillibacter cinnamivorans]|uniref:TVP38/TMEM64 family membrane protein n=1 Tax=Papillibacter cinnamivorans DSM 12816 TaxID=1122930 RepID=A0A1W2AA12_9FIRM|nr:TVP38/TMEM64 family protein [Papillibacter cinnamivorans]SMC57579.1 Uncharacterized membrane protein YdjX, TVP38/TMEM64 family, SNARE-associated domain [Papillibacter cinnamivorans DSM 12816]
MKGKISKILILAAFGLLLASASLYFLPKMALLLQADGQARFRQWMDSFGALGWVILLLIQIGQVVIAFVPGEPVEIVSGLLYGTMGGLALCMAGVVIGSFISFFLARRFGLPLIKGIFSEKQLSHFKILRNAKHGEAFSLILYLIPGTPKDFLTYIAGLTSVKMPGFILLSTLARIPCVVCSTFTGNSIMAGDYKLAAFVFGGMALLTIPGFLFYRRYARSRETKRSGENSRSGEDGKLSNTIFGFQPSRRPPPAESQGSPEKPADWSVLGDLNKASYGVDFSEPLTPGGQDKKTSGENRDNKKTP